MAKTERSGHTTTDHDFIRQWVEERGGWPARVKGTEGSDDAGLIRVDFPGYSGEGSLEQIEWDEWFQKFDESELAFLHRDMSHGGGDLDRFNKLVRRGGDDSEGEPSGGRGRSSSRKNGGTSRAAASTGAGNGKSGGRQTASSRGGSSAKSGGASKSSSGAKSGGAARSRGSATGETSSSGASSRGNSSRASTSSKGSDSNGANGSSRRSGTSAGAAREQGAEPSELRELLLHELGDLLFAERQFLVGTRALAREAQNPEVKTRIEEHVTETQGQIERLQQAFGAIGERAKPVKCEAALGLREEHDSFKSEEKPSKALLSAFDLGSGLRVEHYEIAGYRSAIAVATALGERECAALLKESLQEELAMASFLEKNSLAVLREMARA